MYIWCFPVFGFMNEVVVNTLVYTIWWTYALFFSVYLEMGFLSGRLGICLTLEDTVSFPMLLNQFKFPPAVYECSSYSIPLALDIIKFLTLTILVDKQWNIIVV